jgi:hypothetical protein
MILVKFLRDSYTVGPNDDGVIHFAVAFSTRLENRF